jgi:hypothetical protein
LQEELEEVTFRPAINEGMREFEGTGTMVDVAERNRVWLENREKKIEGIKAQRLENEMNDSRECTFRPQLNKVTLRVMERKRKQSLEDSVFGGLQEDGTTLEGPKSVVNQAKGVDEFIKRLSKAKQQKLELEEALKRQPGSGTLWKPQLTTPRVPNISFFKNQKTQEPNVI